MTDRRRRILVVCILALASAGCASQSGNDFVSDAFRRGAQLEQQGQYFRAAEAYLIVLGSQSANRKARADLSGVIDQAATEKLNLAATLEAEQRLD